MTKFTVYLVNLFAKITLNISIVLLVLLLVFSCVRMIVLELNVNELENEITYYQNQKPQKKPGSQKAI